MGRNDPDRLSEDRERVDTAMTAAGRDPGSVQCTVNVLVDLRGKAGRPRKRHPALTGTPEELAEAFRAYARNGISHLQIVLDPNTAAGIEALVPTLELLDG